MDNCVDRLSSRNIQKFINHYIYIKEMNADLTNYIYQLHESAIFAA
jgi:hypothetical protein